MNCISSSKGMALYNLDKVMEFITLVSKIGTATMYFVATHHLQSSQAPLMHLVTWQVQ